MSHGLQCNTYILYDAGVLRGPLGEHLTAEGEQPQPVGIRLHLKTPVGGGMSGWCPSPQVSGTPPLSLLKGGVPDRAQSLLEMQRLQPVGDDVSDKARKRRRALQDSDPGGPQSAAEKRVNE